MSEERNELQNGRIAFEEPGPQAGLQELGRIVAAYHAGQYPDPADLAAVRALQPAAAKLPALNVGEAVADLHSGDPDRVAAAWSMIAPLLPLPLDAASEHASNPPPVSWLVKGWMPDATLSVLTGGGGAGKSRIALQLAVAVATGASGFIAPSGKRRPVNCHAPEVLAGLPAPVVFAAWETRRLAFANRLAALCGQGPERAADMEALEGRLHYVNMRPAGGLWGAAHGAHTSTAGGWLPGGDALRAYAERAAARLLIIDPLAAAFVANENDRALVRAFLSALDQWAEDMGCAVLIISHPPKSDSAQSGSTDWRNGVQAVWELTTADKDDPDGLRRLKVDKLNEGPIPAAVRVDYEGGWFVEVNDTTKASQDNNRENPHGITKDDI